MMRTVNAFSKNDDHQYGEMCVVIILSHGNDGGLINAADGKSVSTEYVLRKFNNDACPALKGKPKFFFKASIKVIIMKYKTIKIFDEL